MKAPRPFTLCLVLLLLALPVQRGHCQTVVPAAVGNQSSTLDTAALSLPDTTWDYRVLKSLQSGRSEGWNRHWLTVSNTFVLAPFTSVGFAVGGLCTNNDPLRSNQLYADALEFLGAYTLCMGVTMGMKAAFRRPRPWVAYEGDLLCLQPVRSASFPSGHTSTLFVTATSLTLMYPRWYVAVPAYLWAGSVAFSRLYVGAHYPTDVLAGALIGTGCAFLAHAVRVRICKEHPELYPPSAVLLPLSFSF